MWICLSLFVSLFYFSFIHIWNFVGFVRFVRSSDFVIFLSFLFIFKFFVSLRKFQNRHFLTKFSRGRRGGYFILFVHVEHDPAEKQTRIQRSLMSNMVFCRRFPSWNYVHYPPKWKVWIFCQFFIIYLLTKICNYNLFQPHWNLCTCSRQNVDAN